MTVQAIEADEDRRCKPTCACTDCKCGDNCRCGG